MWLYCSRLPLSGVEALAGSWVFSLFLLFFDLLLTAFGLMAFILLDVVSVVSVVSDGADLFLELMSVMWVSELSSESFSVSSSNEMIALSLCEFSCYTPSPMANLA